MEAPKDNRERGPTDPSGSRALAAVQEILQRMRAAVEVAGRRDSEADLERWYVDLEVLEQALAGRQRELQTHATPRSSSGLRPIVERLHAALDAERGEFHAQSSSLDELLGELARLVATLEGGDAARCTDEPLTLEPAEPPGRASAAARPIDMDPVDADPTAKGFHASVARKLALLRHLLALEHSVFEPALDPHAALGHSCAFVDEHFGCPRGAGLTKLEDLADLGLLQRELVNRVHTCPTCQHCQINFREQCPSCSSISLKREQIVHHFRCGYTGLESEYTRDFELVCPKCRKELFQLGQDFDRPHETYICGKCHYLFEEPQLQGQCLNCTALFHSSEADEVRVFRYRPTPLTIRAVELGRLTGLEVDSILYDADLQVATRDFLDFVVKRELIRLGRYTTAFSTCTVALTRAGRVFPIFREGDTGRVRKLCILLSRSLRGLDLVTRLDSGRLGILMPESGTQGPAVVHDRLLQLFEEFQLTDDAGRPLAPLFESVTWTEPGTTFDQVRAFLDGPGEAS